MKKVNQVFMRLQSGIILKPGFESCFISMVELGEEVTGEISEPITSDSSEAFTAA